MISNFGTDQKEKTYSLQQKAVAEFLGTWTFFFIIQSSPSHLDVPIGLFIALILFGNISGGHFNPAVSVLKILDFTISL